VRVLEIPQLVAPGQVESRDTLPSFHFQPLASPDPRSPSPDPQFVVGFMARDHGSDSPGRLITSAKSWLCHTGVDRTAELLPWHAAADVERISPVEASSRYLAHIRTAWNGKFKSEPLERQDIVLTLPASFDEIARELTVQAAARAGLSRVVLIAEPQAAFYAWIYKHQANWEQLVSPGQKILVCDIGGGTTDFTLIRVRRGDDDKVQFHRVAVGDHLILGGDNMDLALAALGVEAGRFASAAPMGCALRKPSGEGTIAEQRSRTLTITLPGSGSNLSAVAKNEVRRGSAQILLKASCPVALPTSHAAERVPRVRFPLRLIRDYATFSSFFTAHRWGRGSGIGVRGRPILRPDVVLFNGGVGSTAARAADDSLVNGSTVGGLQTSCSITRPSGCRRTRATTAWSAAAKVKIVASLRGLLHRCRIAARHGGRSLQCRALPRPRQRRAGAKSNSDRQFDLLVSEPVEFPLYTSSAA
jgi:hypothetical protein